VDRAQRANTLWGVVIAGGGAFGSIGVIEKWGWAAGLVWLLVCLLLFVVVAIAIEEVRLRKDRKYRMAQRNPSFWKTLSLKQKTLFMYLGSVLIALLYVPCYREIQNLGQSQLQPLGYRFLPTLVFDQFQVVHINGSILFLEILVLTVGFGITYIWLKAKSQADRQIRPSD